MRSRNRGWKLFWFLISILQLAAGENIDNFHNSTNKDGPNQRSLFSPRMDYEQWKPLGHGDPLKNDPTYDYVPPVLDRVHYWADSALRKPDSAQHGDSKKTEILLLGVSSKKAAVGSNAPDSRRDPFDPYVKYVENNHFNQNQRISRPSYAPPMSPTMYSSMFQFQNKNKYSDRASYSKGTEQRVPYTVLMPPPMDIRNREVPKNAITPRPLQILPASTFLLSTVSPVTPAVTIEESNLIYHSSSLSDESEFQNNQNIDFETINPSINWELTSTTQRSHVNFNEQFVYNKNLLPPESFIHIEFSPQNLSNKHLDAADSNHNVNYVTPPPLINMVMHKGHVSDDDDISNSYVKIGKPEAEVRPTGIDISNVRPPSPLKMFPRRYSKPYTQAKKPPMTLQTLNFMQTIQPPPMTNTPMRNKQTNLVKLLAAERSRPVSTTPSEILETTQFLQNPSVVSGIKTTLPISNLSTTSTTSSTSTYSLVPSTTPPSTSSSTTSSTTRRTTTNMAAAMKYTATEQPLTTTMASLTTDPLFKHYKQPVELLKGPLYLIIQGHSKVKTYGPKKQMHGIPIQETNEISDNVDYVVTHLHGFRDKDPIARKSRNRNLQTLKHVIQTGLGAIDFEDVSEENTRNNEDFQETNLRAGYEVVDSKDVTSERYRKGIVEAARRLRL